MNKQRRRLLKGSLGALVALAAPGVLRTPDWSAFDGEAVYGSPGVILDNMPAQDEFATVIDCGGVSIGDVMRAFDAALREGKDALIVDRENEASYKVQLDHGSKVVRIRQNEPDQGVTSVTRGNLRDVTDV